MKEVILKALLSKKTAYAASTGLAGACLFVPVLGGWAFSPTAWALGAAAPALLASYLLSEKVDDDLAIMRHENHMGTRTEFLRQTASYNLASAQLTAQIQDIMNPERGPVLDAEVLAQLALAGGNAGALPTGYSHLCAALAKFGAGAVEVRQIQSPYFTRHILKLGPKPGDKQGRPTKAKDIINLAEDLQLELGCDAMPLVTVAGEGLRVDVPLPEDQRKAIAAEDIIKPSSRTHADELVLSLGVAIDGTHNLLNLSDPTTPHTLVGGTTGSGKTEFLRQLLYSAVTWYPPDVLAIAICDPKRVSFNDFGAYDGMIAPVAKTPDDSARLLSALVVEMERRWQSLEASGSKDISEHNAKGNSLARILVLVDEYFELLRQCDDELFKDVEGSLKAIAQKARAVGIHLVLATQKPVAKSPQQPKGIDSVLRANLPASVALKVRNASDSDVVLCESGAEKLLGKGDMLARLTGDPERYQSPLITDPQSVALAIARYGHNHPLTIPAESAAPPSQIDQLNALLGKSVTPYLPDMAKDFLSYLAGKADDDNQGVFNARIIFRNWGQRRFSNADEFRAFLSDLAGAGAIVPTDDTLSDFRLGGRLDHPELS